MSWTFNKSATKLGLLLQTGSYITQYVSLTKSASQVFYTAFASVTFK
jgi:hypothetical protein